MKERSFAAVALCLLACAATAAASASGPAGRELLQDRIGIKTTDHVEAPQAVLWTAGAATYASAPAEFSREGKLTGPDPPSFAGGINPAGGFHEINTKSRFDTTLPKAHLDARTSLANVAAADVAVGTNRLIPTYTGRVRVRPTVPVTLPVFSFGGKLLPEPRSQVVINPRNPPADKDGSRRLLQDRIGIKTTDHVEAPQAVLWTAGAATYASAPAEFSREGKLTGPDPPSFAGGINPAGGFHEINTKSRFDTTLPKAHLDARTSLANVAAADVAVGTNRLIPTYTGRVRVRPTVPVTLPVFSFGGKLLPEPRSQVVINPRNPPADKDGSRRLLNFGASDSFEAKAPSTPTVKVSQNMAPGVASSSTNVRSEHPSFEAKYSEPGTTVAMDGQTAVAIAPQKGFKTPKGNGKGDWIAFDASRGPDTVTSSDSTTINWPSGTYVASGNNPLIVDSADEYTLPNPTRSLGVSVTPANLGALPDGYIATSSSANVPLIPGLALNGRRLLNFGASDSFEAKAPSTPTVKVSQNMAPGVASSSTNVRSEHPSFEAKYSEPGTTVAMDGQTAVAIAPQKGFKTPKGNGKGDWIAFDASRGPDTVTSSDSTTINWPSGTYVASGNNPLIVDSADEYTLPNPTRSLGVSVTPANLGALPDGYIATSSSANVPLIPGLALNGK